jgi:outer membrane lipase/esterase
MVTGGDSYMFADQVHPTQAAHQILGDYAAGVTTTLLNVAPAVASTMQQLPLSNGENIARIVDNHTRSLEGTRNLTGDYRIFMDLSSNPTDIDATGYGPSFNAKSSTGNVTVGVDLLLSNNGFAGFALGRHQYGGKFSEGTAKLDGEETSLSFYGKAFAGKAYVGWLLGLGMIDYSNVDTRLNAGLISDTKHGETTADRKMARIEAGFPLSMGNMLTVTPKLDVTQQNLHISAFADNGSNATRMTMGAQSVKSLVGGAGLALEGQFQSTGFSIRPYLEGSYKHEFKDDARSVDVGIGTMLMTYKAELPKVDTSYGTVDVGINFDINKATTVGVNFAKTLGLDNIDQQHYGMSISSRF